MQTIFYVLNILDMNMNLLIDHSDYCGRAAYVAHSKLQYSKGDVRPEAMKTIKLL